MFRPASNEIVEVRVDRNRFDFRSRGHEGAREHFAEIKRAAGEPRFGSIHYTCALHAFHEQAQFLNRMHHLVAGGGLEAQHPERGIADRVQCRHGPFEDRVEQLNRPRDPQRRDFRLLKREPFGRQFADDDVDAGNEKEGDADGD